MPMKALLANKAPFPSAMNHKVAMNMSPFLVILFPKL